ncbi:serine/threonine-protein kinase [Phormidium sp. CCY1219]|uniref:serine/threonine-protein kinase n=1 Tax=Phormidium sp. CCY1219 TaxID=2886104 RepID=UPI002D1E58EA|nr:serine/threonine-protein kinase [Phormidium sp. CCY1219]MEB3827810.1 serine/threonine protein kinase [Phormidium sp. CCY1219]
MNPLYCSNGHDNLPNSRYCQYCGEALQQLGSGGFAPGTIVGDRYRIIRQLGHGGFGRTYLAEDINRFNEYCVLKEFAPKVRGTYAQQKAQELFKREAGVLYQLQHPQIPKFRELCRSNVGGASHLFLVQDYVEGHTYRALLSQSRRNGKLFTRAEVIELLQQLLPVLEYIHSQGVIHRDISPDNLIERSADRMPVLIDFGGVKQVEADVESQVMVPPGGGAEVAIPTRLGKVGYAPEEQMMHGRVYPHSDLYALAVTMVVLLTGREPLQLFDPQARIWKWTFQVKVGGDLQEILNKMMSPRESDRYQNATQVRHALSACGSQTIALSTPIAPLALPQGNPNTSSATVFPTEMPPEIASASTTVPPSVPGAWETEMPVSGGMSGSGASGKGQLGGSFFAWRNLLLVLLLMVSAGSLGWWGGNVWVKHHSVKALSSQGEPNLFDSTDPQLAQFSSRYSSAELERKQALRDRRQALGVDYQFYVDLINERFYQRYPTQRGRILSYEPADVKWRERWDAIASEMLDYLATLSVEAREQLGSYDPGDLDRSARSLNRLQLSSRALYDLADAKFFYDFPELKGLDFIDGVMGQVWQAIVLDQLKALQNRETLETISFAQGAYRHRVRATLSPGGGKAYTAYLAKGQILRLFLQANGPTRLSIYTPNGTRSPLLEDAPNKNWSGTLPESGHYEFVVVSDATQPISYQLILAADRVTFD